MDKKTLIDILKLRSGYLKENSVDWENNIKDILNYER